MLQKFFTKMKDEKGQGLVEYALIIVLVSIVCMIALSALGVSVSTVFDDITTALGLRPA